MRRTGARSYPRPHAGARRSVCCRPGRCRPRPASASGSASARSCCGVGLPEETSMGRGALRVQPDAHRLSGRRLAAWRIFSTVLPRTSWSQTRSSGDGCCCRCRRFRVAALFEGVAELAERLPRHVQRRFLHEPGDAAYGLMFMLTFVPLVMKCSGPENTRSRNGWGYLSTTQVSPGSCNRSRCHPSFRATPCRDFGKS